MINSLNIKGYRGLESLSSKRILEIWYSLKSIENNTIEFLQIIDKKIESIIPRLDKNYICHGGFEIKLKDKPPVPIGSMGDGIWRLLS